MNETKAFNVKRHQEVLRLLILYYSELFVWPSGVFLPSSEHQFTGRTAPRSEVLPGGLQVLIPDGSELDRHKLMRRL